MFRSWDAPKAASYRRLNGISEDAGTAVAVQTMVYGNAGGESGAGVAFTRNPATGAREMYFDFQFNAQGEDVVAGRHRMRDNERLRLVLPAVWARLNDICRELEALFIFLVERGCAAGEKLVGGARRGRGFSVQANRKTREGTRDRDRDAQFEYINEEAAACEVTGERAISVDTKKKELVGDLENAGGELRGEGRGERVRVLDFVVGELGEAVPCGFGDVAGDVGWVYLGVSRDAAVFSVESIRRWWYELGASRYLIATRLLITADCGGSNGVSRRRAGFRVHHSVRDAVPAPDAAGEAHGLGGGDDRRGHGRGRAAQASRCACASSRHRPRCGDQNALCPAGAGSPGGGAGGGMGVASGAIALDSEAVQRLSATGTPTILVRRDTATTDIEGMALAAGILTASGGRTSHAAVVARQLGKVCLVACPELEIDMDHRRCRIGGTLLNEGDFLSLDGNTGAVHPGRLAMTTERPERVLAAIADWRGAVAA